MCLLCKKILRFPQSGGKIHPCLQGRNGKSGEPRGRVNFTILKHLFSVHPINALYQMSGLDWWLISVHLNFRSLAPPLRKIRASAKQSIIQDQRASPELEMRRLFYYISFIQRQCFYTSDSNMKTVANEGKPLQSGRHVDKSPYKKGWSVSESRS